MALWHFGDGVGTHALVIGVGRYPHLQGGEGPLFAQHQGMGQLTSAPVSARAFAGWLATTYQRTADATHPLRTLQLLISEPGPSRAHEPRHGAGAQSVERATFDRVSKAIDDWSSRLDLSPDDRAIFYFCGHGISAGLQTTLLLEDFGSVPRAPLRHAIDFNRFYLALDRVAARTQCFFLDTCRVASPVLLSSFQSYGDSILTPPNRLSSSPRKAPTFFSALPGMAAYGRPDRTSLFTEALLHGLRGSGAAMHQRSWSILPSVLYRAIERGLERSAKDAGSTQSCTVDHLVDFPFHVLGSPPSVPVSVECHSPIDLTTAVLRVSGATGNREQSPPVPRPWCFELPTGPYHFLAIPPTGTPHSLEELVYPPYTDIVLP
jgi:hypothetical protein